MARLLAFLCAAAAPSSVVSVRSKQSIADAANSFAALDDYFVFVKKAELFGDFITMGLAWHTETIFCRTKTTDAENVREFLKDKVVSQAGGVLEVIFGIGSTNNSVVTNHEIGVVGPYFSDCYVSGFANVDPAPITFEDKTLDRFYGPHGDIEYIYVGERRLDLADFIGEMKHCGNWNNQYYSLLKYNCNTWTNTLMTALRLESPTFRPETLIASQWIPHPGYFDVVDEKCKGTKCTGPDDYTNFPANMHKSVCSKGVCHEGGEFKRGKCQ
eukprot:TRINITY_DN82487_c0_g1_i1.p1 TRINITY_DN82487_c0_g1~~TRINITY_DN82487_c0_g1_i1.p1  ORF type:complete len:271 (-),score=35.79 TRINITY_DN82487_c0_g1_i1:75-887(-)